MASRTIAFLLGVLAFQQLPFLPRTTHWIAFGAFFLLLLIVCLWSARIAARPEPRWVGWLAVGFAWAGLRAAMLLADALPPILEGRDLQVEGVIQGLPEKQGGRVRFDFLPESVREKGSSIAFHGRMRLTWYDDPPDLHAGERWSLSVRVKKPHGLANPGGFDYESWLFQRRIHAVGYVRMKEPYERIATTPRLGVDRWRDRLREKLDQALVHTPRAGVVVALAIGDGNRISDKEWDLFRATGTTHLMAISGLHVGMVAALAAWLTRRTWRLPRLIHTLPAPKAAVLAGLVAAAVYALMAGFSVPTQRTLVMIGAVAVALLSGRVWRPSTLLAISCWAVLLYDPLAVLAPGFWLSFGAVALILFGLGGRLHVPGLWWRWGRMQWLLALGLAPLLIVLFGSASVVSPLANLVAVPWISLVVVPFTLMGTTLLLVWPAAGRLLLHLAGEFTDAIWPLLEGLARWLPAVSWPSPPFWILICGLAGMALLLAPRGWPGRSLGVLWCLPFLAWQPDRPEVGEAWLTMLDVGQGLAVVVETQGHVLVFDTGPRLGPDFDTGEAVVAPFLHSRGWSRVDTLMLSHGDGDHTGGARSLSALLPIREVLAAEPDRVNWITSTLCARGMTWTWEGVDFNVLHPVAGHGNDHSCVLRITTAGGAFLLTGDIEAAAEEELLRSRQKLRATGLVVPHHGSKSSSTEPFLAAVRPEAALFSVGYRNRYRFPNSAVVARYQAIGAHLFQTAVDGAVTMRLHADGSWSSECWRERAARYWQLGSPESP